MSKSFLDNKKFDPNDVEDINTVIANCGIRIGNLPSLLIEVFREYFPDAEIKWLNGCRIFYINGIKYEMHMHFYWTYDAPKFYKSINQ